MLQELNAEHAPQAQNDSVETNVTTLRESANGKRRIPDPQSSHAEPDSDLTAPNSERDARLETALQRAENDEIAVVTVRVSVRLNKYMDEYVARTNRLDPKRKYRKQDAVAEAFAAFYADHPLPHLSSEEVL